MNPVVDYCSTPVVPSLLVAQAFAKHKLITPTVGYCKWVWRVKELKQTYRQTKARLDVTDPVTVCSSVALQLINK